MADSQFAQNGKFSTAIDGVPTCNRPFIDVQRMQTAENFFYFVGVVDSFDVIFGGDDRFQTGEKTANFQERRPRPQSAMIHM